MEFPDVSLALIAGGRASRLSGAPKGLLRLHGRTLLERHLALGRDFAEVLLVANEPAPYARFHLRTVADEVPGKGAPGGVHAALVHARTPWLLALAIDMPLVTVPALRVLIAERGRAPLVCFEVGGRLEPLMGVYATQVEPAWRARLAEDPPFRRLFEELGGLTLGEQALREVDPELRSISNVNTPGDLERLGLDWPDGWSPSGGA